MGSAQLYYDRPEKAVTYGGTANEVKRNFFTEKGTVWEMPIQFRNDWDAG